jgi:hypothetical protein
MKSKHTVPFPCMRDQVIRNLTPCNDAISSYSCNELKCDFVAECNQMIGYHVTNTCQRICIFRKG